MNTETINTRALKNHKCCERKTANNELQFYFAQIWRVTTYK